MLSIFFPKIVVLKIPETFLVGLSRFLYSNYHNQDSEYKLADSLDEFIQMTTTDIADNFFNLKYITFSSDKIKKS